MLPLLMRGLFLLLVPLFGVLASELAWAVVIAGPSDVGGKARDHQPALVPGSIQQIKGLS
jgi:hypothetical protein